MRKTIVLAACLCAVAGAVMAAPVTYVAEHGANVGYGYQGAKDGSHVLYGEYGLTDKVVVGLEYRKLIHEGNEIDLYGKYRLNNNFYVTAGSREVDRTGRAVFAGVEGMTYLTDKMDAYAGAKFSSKEKEYKVGVLYDLDPRLDLDINYTFQDRKDTSDRKGVGVGLNYRF